MGYQDDRQMYDVDEKCAECSAAIKQLPFQPSGDKPLYCSDCLRARRNSRDGGGSRPPRQMYDVDVDCAECGNKITQLPFQPSGDRPIYCFDCNKARHSR